MGDSSGGAQPAEDNGDEGSRRNGAAPARALTPRNGTRPGFFGRIFGALNPSEDDRLPAVADAAPTAGPAVRATPASLRRLSVADVMVPKAEIVSVPVDVSREDLAQAFRDSGVSRLPVYRGTLDTPAGLVHLKDFALKYGFGAKAGRFSMAQLLRPLLYVPPSMPLSALLQKMQAERVHMALVIDEYGGVDGLVTIEDIIEQVVGEIEDEHDTEEGEGIRQEAPGLYQIRATVPLAELEAEVGCALADSDDQDEVDTVGGLVVMLAGRVPARGEVVQHPDGHEFVVVDADARRVKRVRLRLRQPVMATE